MTATERVINLALLLGANARDARGVAVERIRREVYPSGQSDDAFERMFVRDKETLRAAGLIIEADAEGGNRLVAAGTFCAVPKLSAAERATLALSGFAQLDEPLFPLPFALRLALTKLSGLLDADAAPALRRLPVSSALGIRDTETAGRPEGGDDASLHLELLLRACQKALFARITYTNRAGISSQRLVAPYGLFLLSGRWYLVAHDETHGETRTFKLGRISTLTLIEERFEPPKDFSLAEWVCLPFEIGTKDAESVQTSIVIPADYRGSLESLTQGRGQVTPQEDGSLVWRVVYRDLDELVTFVLEKGLGFGEAREQDFAKEALERMVKAS